MNGLFELGKNLKWALLLLTSSNIIPKFIVNRNIFTLDPKFIVNKLLNPNLFVNKYLTAEYFGCTKLYPEIFIAKKHISNHNNVN